MDDLALALAFACAGLTLVLLLRRPLHRLIGPRPVFALWTLPWLLAALPWLPVATLGATGFAGMPSLPALLVTPETRAGNALPPPWQILWWSGCALLLLRLAVHYLRLARSARALPKTGAQVPLPRGLDRRRVRIHPAGPAVIWWPRARVLLPADFTRRFDATSQSRVLRHEHMHLKRLDPLWSLLAELSLAVLWFFPLSWLAIRRFRLDQELACDAAVLEARPDDIAGYAASLLRSHQAQLATAALTPWLSRSQLKERLTMIRHHQRSTPRRWVGYAAVALLLAGTGLAAQAALPATTSDTASHAPIVLLHATQTNSNTATTPTASHEARVDAKFRTRHPPTYPISAIKKKQQGTVLLDVKVDAKGVPVQIRIQTSSGSAALDGAAVAAAGRWKFHPATEHGKPVASWIRVPVKFSLHEDDSNEPAAPASGSTDHGKSS